MVVVTVVDYIVATAAAFVAVDYCGCLTLPLLLLLVPLMALFLLLLLLLLLPLMELLLDSN